MDTITTNCSICGEEGDCLPVDGKMICGNCEGERENDFAESKKDLDKVVKYLIDLCVRTNSERFTYKADGVTINNGKHEIGDWRLTIEKIKQTNT